MEDTIVQDRILAFNLAVEITPEEKEQVSGGQSLKTYTKTHESTMGGGDQNYDSNSD